MIEGTFGELVFTTSGDLTRAGRFGVLSFRPLEEITAKGGVANVNVPADELADIAINQAGVLRDEPEIDARMSVSLEGRDVRGNLRGGGAGTIDVLRFINDDDGVSRALI